MVSKECRLLKLYIRPSVLKLEPSFFGCWFSHERRNQKGSPFFAQREVVTEAGPLFAEACKLGNLYNKDQSVGLGLVVFFLWFF